MLQVATEAGPVALALAVYRRQFATRVLVISGGQDADEHGAGDGSEGIRARGDQRVQAVAGIAEVALVRVEGRGRRGGQIAGGCGQEKALAGAFVLNRSGRKRLQNRAGFGFEERDFNDARPAVIRAGIVPDPQAQLLHPSGLEGHGEMGLDNVAYGA